MNKVAFFTEMGFTGKVPRTHKNMRTEFAWMVAMNADHYNISQTPTEDYDLGIVIVPKKNPSFTLDHIKSKCKKVGVMQEGPHTLFQDYTLEQQIQYLNLLSSSDIIFTHNKVDQRYYKGLTNHSDVRILPSLMIEDPIGEIKKVERQGVIIGGNFVSWYGGMDSYMVAREIQEPIYCPSMGRKQPGEEALVKHLPYMEWTDWIHNLNNFKYAIHLMRTHAAGTFALNTAFLGIPCIGYEGLDTQEILHPNLTIPVGDLENAKKVLILLQKDKDFYNEQSKIAKENYKNIYHEDKFNTAR